MPKVSVIIPAYNAMAYLPWTLESVLKQTFTDFEVLIINDGSSDGIVEWASQRQDARVRLISQENQGLSGARNTGIWYSQGEYLAFLDADDIWEPTKLEKQVLCLDQDLSIGLVSSWISSINEYGDILEVHHVPKSVGIELKRELFTYNLILSGSTPLVRRCCFEKVGFFECSLSGAADWDMWLRIAQHYLISVVQEPLVRYRRHSNSMSKNLRAMLQDVDRVMHRAFELPLPEVKHLKGIGASLFCVSNAWGCAIKGDTSEAFWFTKQAFIRRPQLAFSISYIKLLLFVTAKHFLKPHIYQRLHSALFNPKQGKKKQYE
jgi:glycosyltransferase involved in cell wall biosynthesis